MLQGMIRNDDFQRNTALECWNNVVTIRNNVETMLQRCVALKIVVVNGRRVTSPLVLQICILSGAIKFVPAWSSQENLSLFEITQRASILFFQNFRGNLSYYESDNFLIPPSIIFSNPKILGFCTKFRLTWAVKCEKLNF